MTFEEKMEIVINNYFKKECSVNTSIREAFEKGFRIGVKKGQSAQPEHIKGHWIEIALSNHTYKCSVCGRLLVNITDGKNNVAKNYPYCHCGADMREVTT